MSRSKRYRNNLNEDYFYVLPLDDDNDSGSGSSVSSKESNTSRESINSTKFSFNYQEEEQFDCDSDEEFDPFSPEENDNTEIKLLYSNASLNYEQFVYSFLCLLDQLKISKVNKHIIIIV